MEVLLCSAKLRTNLLQDPETSKKHGPGARTQLSGLESLRAFHQLWGPWPSIDLSVPWFLHLPNAGKNSSDRNRLTG